MGDYFVIRGIVRQIIVGQNVISENMNLSVGQKISGKVISRIQSFDDSLSFHVFVVNKDGREVVWKSYNRMPVSVEYFDSDGDAPKFDDLIAFQKSDCRKLDDFVRQK